MLQIAQPEIPQCVGGEEQDPSDVQLGPDGDGEDLSDLQRADRGRGRQAPDILLFGGLDGERQIAAISAQGGEFGAVERDLGRLVLAEINPLHCRTHPRRRRRCSPRFLAAGDVPRPRSEAGRG